MEKMKISLYLQLCFSPRQVLVLFAAAATFLIVSW